MTPKQLEDMQQALEQLREAISRIGSTPIREAVAQVRQCWSDILETAPMPKSEPEKVKLLALETKTKDVVHESDQELPLAFWYMRLAHRHETDIARMSEDYALIGRIRNRLDQDGEERHEYRSWLEATDTILANEMLRHVQARDEALAKVPKLVQRMVKDLLRQELTQWVDLEE